MEADAVWSAVLELCRELGPVEEGRSRYADKPALFLGRREFAHAEGRGLVDLRITAAGWRRHAETFGSDVSVARDSGRRDWIDLRLASIADVERLRPLFEAAVAANS